MAHDLTQKEEAMVSPIVAEIAKEPGLPARDLAALIHRNMSVTLRVVQRLVDAGVVERRQVWRVRSDRRERGYSGLYLAEGRKPDAAVQAPESDSTPPPALVLPLTGPSMSRRMGKAVIGAALETMRTSTLTVATRELDPARAQLRGLGERLGWGRLPLTQGETRGSAFLPGRSIASGEEAWQRALEELSDEDVDAALNAGRRLAALLGA